MKTLLISLLKGGVGKSMITGQLARYCAHQGLRTLVIDTDDQGNATNSLERDQFAIRLPQTITPLLCRFDSSLYDDYEFPPVAICAADGFLTSTVVEHAKNKLNGSNAEFGTTVAENFYSFLEIADSHFDICIIDSPPASDIRVTAALCIADAVLSPILLAQECLEGMGQFIQGSRGVNTIKNKSNPKLDFLGFVPNMVESNEKQSFVLEAIAASPYGGYLFMNEHDEVMSIPKRQALIECQAEGKFIGDMAKVNTSAREAWRKVKPLFQNVIERMGLNEQVEAIAENKSSNIY